MLPRRLGGEHHVSLHAASVVLAADGHCLPAVSMVSEYLAEAHARASVVELLRPVPRRALVRVAARFQAPPSRR